MANIEEHDAIISSKRWTDFHLSDRLLKALSDLKYKHPTKIQAKALKVSLKDGKNILGAARTGSGKTLAYGISIVQQILQSRDNLPKHMKMEIEKQHANKSDFELINGEMMEVEDMIVDNNSSKKIESSNLSSDVSCPDAVILVPTRELAHQVKIEIDSICKYTKVSTCCIIGGMNQDKQIRILEKIKPNIVIGTPGRLLEIIESNSSEHLNIFSLASIRFLTIDEADRMVQKGHFEEMLKIIDIINEFKPKRGDIYAYNVYLFSATLTFLHELPNRLKNNFKKKNKSKGKAQVNVDQHTKLNLLLNIIKLLKIQKKQTVVIDLNNEKTYGRPSSCQLEEFRIHCAKNEKDLYLYYFLQEYKGRRILIFCNSKDCLRRLVNVLKFLNINCLKLHSDMDQKKRLQSLEKFRLKPDSVMIATDVAARGLDIKELDCVVHYQVPRTCESYIHRSGRTARLDNKGVVLVICEPAEVHQYRTLCNNINQGNDLRNYEIDLRLREKLKQRVNLAQQMDILEHQIRSSNCERNWFTKAAKECDIELDDDDMRHINGRGKMLIKDTEADILKQRQLTALTKKLNKLLG